MSGDDLARSRRAAEEGFVRAEVEDGGWRSEMLMNIREGRRTALYQVVRCWAYFSVGES